MNTLCQITTQYYENYGDSKNPHWKPKGSQLFTIDVDSDSFMYVEDNCIKAIKSLLEDQSNNHCRYEYISHELIFSKPIELKGFEEKLESIFEGSL